MAAAGHLGPPFYVEGALPEFARRGDDVAILETLVNTLGPWEIEVLLRTSMEHAREQVPRMVASLEEVEGGVLMRCTVESLDGMARFLAGLFCPFVVRRPDELREALKQHAAEITRLAELG